MEDSTDEYVCKDTSKSVDSSDTALEKSSDAYFDGVIEGVADDSALEEQSNDSSSSTPYQDDSIAIHEQSSSSSSAQIENVEYIPVSEHSVDSFANVDVKNSPSWQEHSSNITSDDSNVNENNESVAMDTNTFDIETSPSKKEIKIDMNPLTETELLGLENDASDSEDSDSKSIKSATNSKVNCNDDSMSLDAENAIDNIAINEDSIKSEADEHVKSDEPEDTEVKEESENMNVDDGDLLSKVNTNLPNTEMSNADLSALEVAQPSAKLANARGVSMETDLLDELSDFCGFEELSAQDSMKALQILRAERDQLLLAMTKKLLDQYANNSTDDYASLSDESRNEGEITYETPSSIAAADSSTPATAAVAPKTSATPASTPASGTVASATPGTPSAESHIIFHKSTGSFVYALAKDVNIFEERVPSGSKRVKKKRKFFGFDEHGDKSARSNIPVLQSSRPSEKPDAPATPRPPKEPENTSTIEKNIVVEDKENFLTEEKPAEEPIVPPDPPAVEPVLPTAALPPSVPKTQPKPAAPTSPTSMPSKIPVKPKRSAFDVSKPLYKEPFKHGWRREIFYRDLPEGSKSKTAYISYFNAQNKKFKTIRQIVEHLPPGTELNEKHFTFSKERIFRDNEPGCDREIVRYQKDITKEISNSSTSSAMSLLNRLKKPDGGSPSPAQDPSKSKLNKKLSVKGDESDDEDVDTPSPSISKMAMPKILIRGVGPNSTKVPSIKSKLSLSKPSSGQKKVSKSSKKPAEKGLKPKGNITEDGDGVSSDLDDGSVSYGLGSAGALSTTPMQKNARETSYCSMSCPPALGHPPTLQCVNCLGLFHHQCCGFDSRSTSNFLCQKCRQPDFGADSGQPPGFGSRIYDESSGARWTGDERPTPWPGGAAPKIVDGLTTWLPSSSNIHLSSTKNAQLYPPADPAAPNGDRGAGRLLQSVLELEGRRYIIVPKENVVSISPNAKESAAAGAVAAAYHAAAEYERSPHQQRQQQFMQRLHAERVDDAGRQRVPSADDSANASSIPNSAFLVTPSHHHHENHYDADSTGVLLVPVMPSGGTGARPSPPYYARDARGGHVGYAACETNAYGSHSLKRRHSNDSDSSIRRAKMARLDGDADHFSYRSSLTLSNISFLYEPLILCFKYLTVKELLRVSMSCKYLNRIASDSALWSTVRLKNSKITDWDGFARTLRKHRTKRLDMWKMLSPTAPDDINAMWDDFCRVIPSVTSLERIDLMRCPSKVVQTAAESCHNLTVINALQLNKNGSLSLSSFTKLKHLRELRLKGFPSISLEPSDRLKFVRTDSLQVLALTNVKNLSMDTLEAISRLSHLRVLELGECETLSHNFTDILSNMKRLERLRLEKVVNLDPDYRMFSLLKDLRHFKSLELINIEVKIGFDEALAHCSNLEEFLLIPLYKTQSATANKVIVNGIQKLSETLKKFVWGLTTELLKVTDIFVQEYQMKAASKTEGSLETNNGNKVVARKGQADSIPILKHLSEHVEKPEVDILTIAQLEKMLVSLLPAARVKVLKIPFNTTGRQSLSDCFK